MCQRMPEFKRQRQRDTDSRSFSQKRACYGIGRFGKEGGGRREGGKENINEHELLSARMEA